MNHCNLFLSFFTVFCNSVISAKPQGDLQLVFANVLWRHGARSPIKALPNDTHSPDVWPQGFGQLTQVGMQQQYKLGKFLKHRYSQLLSARYNRTQIFIRSTDVDRTLMSAECNLAGMFPPEGRQQWNGTTTQWQPIPVHTVPVSEDNLLHFPPANSSRYNEILEKVWNLPQLQEQEKENKKFLDEIRSLTSYPQQLTLRNLYLVTDVYKCEQAESLSLPAWLTAERFARMNKISGLEMGTNFGVNTTYEKEMARLNAGSLVKQILQNMDERISQKSTYNMIAYSAHDTTIAALLVALEVYNMLPPPFASCVMLELYKKTSTDGTVSYIVKTFYRNSTNDPVPLNLLGCALDCPLDELKKRAADVLPPEAPATHIAVVNTDTNSDHYTLVYAAVVTVLLLSTWLAFLVNYVCSKRKSKAWRRRYQAVEPREEAEDDLYLMS